jgi:hypothetical protein
VSDSILNFSRIWALRPLPTAQNFPKTGVEATANSAEFSEDNPDNKGYYQPNEYYKY